MGRRAIRLDWLTTGPSIRKLKFPLLGGRLTVGLRTLNPPIGVRIPASQPHAINELRAATWPPVFVLCAYGVPALLKSGSRCLF